MVLNGFLLTSVFAVQLPDMWSRKGASCGRPATRKPFQGRCISASARCFLCWCFSWMADGKTGFNCSQADFYCGTHAKSWARTSESFIQHGTATLGWTTDRSQTQLQLNVDFPSLRLLCSGKNGLWWIMLDCTDFCWIVKQTPDDPMHQVNLGLWVHLINAIFWDLKTFLEAAKHLGGTSYMGKAKQSDVWDR